MANEERTIASSSSSSLFPVRDSDFSPKKAVRKVTNDNNAPIFDPFFGIRVCNPRFPLETFDVYCKELQKTRLNSIGGTTIHLEHVTMAIVVETSGVRQSSNGNDYVLWHLSDLVADTTVKALLFGDAAQIHSKIPRGHVVALTNSELATDTPAEGAKSTMNTLKISKSLQVLSLGSCPDFGICKGLAKDGKPCTSFVNVTASPLCSYHIQNEARKMRLLRGSLSAISNERPKCQIFKSPQKRPPPTTPKMRTPKTPKNSAKTPTENAERSALASKARFGHRVMMKLEEMEREKENSTPSSPAASPNVGDFNPKSVSSLKEFLGQRSKFDLIRNAAKRVGTPQLGRSVQRGAIADLTSPPKKMRRMSPPPIESPSFDLEFE